MNYFERFLSLSERAAATNELADLGEQALAILESLFNSSAKNTFGIPYSKTGAIDCGFVTVKLLGPVAKALEIYVREGIEQDHFYAIEAAGYLSEIEQETAFALARALIRHPASEAATSLILCGHSENSKVLEIVGLNSTAHKNLEKIRTYMSTKS